MDFDVDVEVIKNRGSVDVVGKSKLGVEIIIE